MSAATASATPRVSYAPASWDCAIETRDVSRRFDGTVALARSTWASMVGRSRGSSDVLFAIARLIYRRALRATG